MAGAHNLVSAGIGIQVVYAEVRLYIESGMPNGEVERRGAFGAGMDAMEYVAGPYQYGRAIVYKLAVLKDAVRLYHEIFHALVLHGIDIHGSLAVQYYQVIFLRLVKVPGALDARHRLQIFPNAKMREDANLLIFPTLDAANIAFNLLKNAAGSGMTVGPILLGAAKPVHILTPSATVRRIVNMTALTVVDANAGR